MSVAVTKDLRAAAWGSDVPVLPAPDWATASQPVTSSGELPVEVRESLSSLSAWLAGVPADGEATKKLYEVDSLALLASAAPASGGGESPMGAMLTARFQAQPFTEPLTRHNYVRARWYDPETGTWLSPDPLGYRDSSNLYAFAGGDPVNGRDPRGAQTAEDDPRDVADSGVDMYYDARKRETQALKTAGKIGRAGYQVLDLATDFAPGIGVLKIPLPFIEAYKRGGRRELMRMGLDAGAVVMISAVLTHRLHPKIQLTKEELALEEKAEFKLSLEADELEAKAASLNASSGLPTTNPRRLLAGKTSSEMGLDFQRSVHEALGIPENTAKFTGTARSGKLVNTEPDLYGLRTGVTEIKDVREISFGEQLQAQFDVARQSNQSFNLIIGPQTETVSRALQQAIRSRGGVIV